MDLTKELEISKEAAIKAGIKIMEIYDDYISNNELVITNKSDDSPLTAADKESNEIIVSMLKENFPAYSILSEETKDDKSRLKNKFCWIVDPLDGTKEFINKNGEFTVNIGLSYEQKPVLGVIYVPLSGELYYAGKNSGAYYEKDEILRKIYVSNKVDRIRVVLSRSHSSKELEQLMEKYDIDEVKYVGSSLKGCIIAKGEAEVYYRYGKTMEWDTAAMHCIVVEAGAVFRQMDGSEILYNRQNSLNDKGFYVITPEIAHK